MDIILFILYLSVYLGIGGILAEFLVNYNDMNKLNIIRNRKAVYTLITSIWPFCIIMFLYELYVNLSKGVK